MKSRSDGQSATEQLIL